MRILIVTQYFWPETFRINDLSIDLIKAGHQVTVLTGIPNYPNGSYFNGYGILKKRQENYNGVKVLRVPLIARGKGGKFRLILNYLSFALSAMVLAPFVCRGKYDIIFVYEPSPITVGLPALVLKKIKQAPIIFWVQDLWPESLEATGSIRSKRILSWVARLTQFIYHRCDRILVQSKAFISSIEQFGVSHKKISYFPNAAEDIYQLVKNENEKINEREKELPQGFRIIFAGNIGVSQSFETILDAASLLKHHSNIHWIIIGDGRQKKWLIEQINRRGLSHSIYLIGQKPVEEMPYYFKLADVLLVSLKKDPIFSLTIPSKLQSYLASGKPILASLDGEAARIVTEAEAGFASVSEDAKSLAHNVLEMYHKPSHIRQQMGENGRLYFEKNFRKDCLLNHLEEWMTELVRKQECVS